MKTDGSDIRYVESHTVKDNLVEKMSQVETLPKSKPEKKLAKETHKEIYRFCAAFKYRSSTWRDIEIQGK